MKVSYRNMSNELDITCTSLLPHLSTSHHGVPLGRPLIPRRMLGGDVWW